MIEIYPSLISANLMNLQQSINTLAPHCQGWHIDIMDNHFVPNLTWGAQFANSIAQNTTKPLWVHLMIDQPTRFLDTLFLPKGSIITFHIETQDNIEALIAAITAKGWQPSIALKPKTDVSACFSYLQALSQVLLMSVEPGFSGQQIIPDVLKKIVPLKHEIEKQRLDINIAMDGGINQKNIVEIARLGVTQFGIASGIFSWPNPMHELEHLHEILKNV